jgi:mRNA interferase RelE/StbE
MHGVAYSKEALKALHRRIRDKIRELAINPRVLRNVKRLSNHPGYRLRVGDWRVIYTVDQGAITIHVIRIEARGGVYQ